THPVGKPARSYEATAFGNACSGDQGAPPPWRHPVANLTTREQTACLKPLVLSRQSPRSGGRCAGGGGRLGASSWSAGRVGRSRGQDGAPGAERGRTILTPVRTVAGSGERTGQVGGPFGGGNACAGRLQFPMGGEGQARPGSSAAWTCFRR